MLAQGVCKCGRASDHWRTLLTVSLDRRSSATRHWHPNRPPHPPPIHLWDHAAGDDALADQLGAAAQRQHAVDGGRVVAIVQDASHICHEDELLRLQRSRNLQSQERATQGLSTVCATFNKVS